MIENSERTVGPAVDSSPALVPQRSELEGRYVRLEPLDAGRHGGDLFEATRAPELWTYMGSGPFADGKDFAAFAGKMAASRDPLLFAIVEKNSGRALGMASFLRIEPAHRVMEVGHIVFSPALQRTRGATEAMYLMARHAFEDLRYRRYEWKCNALNEASRRAALRLGFSFEGIFRQHMIIKGRNRDTAWFAMLDGEWPARKAAFESWLAAANFDEQGRQLRSLSEIRAS